MITLITGGARSGKSTFAGSLYGAATDVVYLATSRVSDRETEERVRLHQSSRPSKWRTYEGNYNLVEAIGDEKNYILDCVTTLNSNILFDISKDSEYIDCEMQREIEDRVLSELKDLVDEMRKRGCNLVLVTNEVGDSIVPDNHISRVFRDIHGRINQRLAALADEVYVVFCGIPLKIK